MNNVQEEGSGVWHLAINLIAVALLVYFTYHLVHGERGYFALQGVEKKISDVKYVHDKKRAEREMLQNKVLLLRPSSLDIDLLDERARTLLGYARSDEWIVIDDAQLAQ